MTHLFDSKQNRCKAPVFRWLIVLGHVYCIGICVWVALRFLGVDRWWWLFGLNFFANYLFLPLPGLLLLGVLARKRIVWVECSLVLGLGVYFYGELFLPAFPRRLPSQPSLTVMTSNINGFRDDADPAVAAIRESQADVVAIQELNLLVAEAIRRDLSVEYPYQALAPDESAYGLGLLSRYPLTATGVALPGRWLGVPQVYALDFAGTRVVVINFHAIPKGDTFEDITFTAREREFQVRELAAFVAATPYPVIALGDLNVSDQNMAYAILGDTLTDAWREAGWGFGHTRHTISPVPVPEWLARIDYVFHSGNWQTSAAWIGPWDGVSDHRPVAARLALR
ncbi:MAG: endonuclease/exonuclease/phosphatase family protein [Anaerolineae bacterium]|nr:endonuclease/exonuclease/phosphatase family protein [Anaerolineae bacterium]